MKKMSGPLGGGIFFDSHCTWWTLLDGVTYRPSKTVFVRWGYALHIGGLSRDGVLRNVRLP